MANTSVTTQKDTPFNAFKSLLAKPAVKEEIKLAAAKHMSPDRMLRIALTAALSSPKLAEAAMTPLGQQSIVRALLTASQRGLEVDGRQGHLVPFRDNKNNCMLAQFIPGYQGLMDLAYNHPKVKAIWAEAVYSNDEFVYQLGLDRVLRHIPYDGEDRGDLIKAYAVCETEGGAKNFVVIGAQEAARAKNMSRGSDSEYSPWVTNTEAMWRKTAIRLLTKFIPQSAELRDGLADDDDGFEDNGNPVGMKPNIVPIEVTSEPAEPKRVGDGKTEQTETKQEQQAETKPEPKKEKESKPKEEPKKEQEPPKVAKQEPAPTQSEGEAAPSAETIVAMMGDVLEVRGIAVKDFLGWVKASGRIRPDAKNDELSDIPLELLQKLMADSNAMDKCQKLYGAKMP